MKIKKINDTETPFRGLARSTANETFIDGDANLQLKLKEAVHKNIYAWTESNLMNRYNATTRVEKQMTWWRATYYGIAGVSGVLMVVGAAMYVMSSKGKEEEV